MNPWSSLPPNMTTTARGLRFSIVSRTCVNQLKTSGRSRPVAIRPSMASTASNARLPAIARSTDSPGTTTSESPAIHTRSFFFGVNLTRAAGSGVATGGGGVGRGAATAVSISSSSERPSAALSAWRGRSSRSAPETVSSGSGHGERDVSLPALRLDRRRLVQPGCVQEERDEEAGEADDDGRPGGMQASASLRGARPGASPRSLVRLHQNWK